MINSSNSCPFLVVLAYLPICIRNSAIFIVLWGRSIDYRPPPIRFSANMNNSEQLEPLGSHPRSPRHPRLPLRNGLLRTDSCPFVVSPAIHDHSRLFTIIHDRSREFTLYPPRGEGCSPSV